MNSTANKTIKVLLVEDHDIVRQGIKALLADNPDTLVIGEARHGAEAIEKVKALHPDVLLMDLNMPVMNGLECTRQVKKDFPEVKVLILSMHDNENYLIDMLEAGANGYILKNTSKDELLFAIKKIANDGIYMGPEFTLNMLAKYKASKGFTDVPKQTDIKLTDREMDVLHLIAQGLTNVEMARKLFTSVRTIETRRKKLLDKTKTTNTATLIRFAVLNGLIK
ncbi:MAG: response regulator transcription factor [Bacteroidetes bacterium]|jgi:DNA-binding NarL/FixJ family response regulator|nr:response regulator transcription factor [Bacteroidota bacterium]